MRERLEALRQQALSELKAAEAPKALEEFRVRFMGKKGPLTELLRGRTDGIPTEAVPLLDMVRQDYELTADAIRAYLNSDDQE